MKNNIFIGASCRYGQLVKPQPYHVQFHHTHNTKEFIQYIEYIQGNLVIPENLQSKVFRSQYLRSSRGEPLLNNNQDTLLKEYSNSTDVIVEICSRKIYQQDGFYLHHLAVDSGDAKNASENYEGNFQIQTDIELYDDLKRMKQMTLGKRLIIATHINPYKFPKRSLLINTLSKYCQDLEICFHNASEIIEINHVNDANHLNEEGHKIQTQTLHQFLEWKN